MTKDQLKKFIVELDKENKKLKKDLEFVYDWKDRLEKENKNLSELLLDSSSRISLMTDKIRNLEEENKKLNEYNRRLKQGNDDLKEQNKKLKETIKDHQLYEEKLEHRIIEFEELLHGE